MKPSAIHWTDYAVNFYDWHCVKVSEGCRNCYAERRAVEFGKVFRGAPQWREEAIQELATVPSGSTIFINTHSDTYIESAPVQWIARIHDIITQSPQYIFLLLTKRPHRALLLAKILKWPDNLWLGTSVENQDVVERINVLRKVPAYHRFVSFEPLLGKITTDLSGLHWVIVGGESGEEFRHMDRGWAAHLHTQAAARNIPFYFKQGAGKVAGMNRNLLGRNYEELPRQFTDLKARYKVEVSQLSLF